MLNFKHFEFRKKEYVILEKDTLEDALKTIITLTSMYENNKVDLADILNVSIRDEKEFWRNHDDYRHIIVDAALKEIFES